ncbi:MAG TPA: deoxyribose-phosphate aldolase [Candidatus Limnocylindria bacterium]|nr:deoxyribose-phosphate aldolase [Candidatus Limnocylindria bacterium]
MTWSGGPIPAMTALSRATRFEHRLTRPNASLVDLAVAAGLATDHGLDGLTVSPWLVKPAARLLARSGVRLGTVIGFPFGGQLPTVKAFEASKALEHGAVELEFALNGGALASGDDEAVVIDMLAVVEMAHSGMAQAGVILPGGMLDEALLRRACRLAARAGADYVVTAAGDDQAADTIERTALLHRVLGGQLGISAAGAFNDASQIAAAIAAGASRISTGFSDALAVDAAALRGRPSRDPVAPTSAGLGVVAR